MDANDTNDYVLIRLRPHFKFQPHQQLIVYFEPQFTAGFGETATTLNAVNSAALGATSGGLNDPTLGVHQGYIQYDPVDWYSIKMGRQEIAYGDHLVVGTVDWSNTGRAFDAVKMKFKGDFYWVDFLWSLLSDAEAGGARPAAAGTVPSGDAHFFGLYSSFDFGDYFKELDFYAFYRLDQTASPRLHNYATLGARLKSKPSAWDYRFEADFQIGKQAGVHGGNTRKDFQVDAEAGYTWEDFYKFRLGVEFAVASQNYNHLFPTAHKWLGFIDLFGRRNIMDGIIHLSMNPNDKWKLKLDAHTVMRTTTSNDLFNLGLGRLGTTGASNSRFAGEEIDFVASYRPIKYLTFAAGASVFIPMGFIKNNIDNEMPIFGWIQTKARF